MVVTFENEVRLSVYQFFVTHCRAPTTVEVADAFAVTAERVHDAFASLAEQHILVLQPDSGELWMAMPFSAVPTPFRVKIQDSAWWANCAWDALGVLAALGQDGEVETRCAYSSADLTIPVRSAALDYDASAVIHFAVPAARWWDDIGYTWSTILLFQSEEDVEGWCKEHDLAKGSIISLDTGWQLARAWYSDRLSPSWQRKSGIETRALFSALRMTSPFWDLDT